MTLLKNLICQAVQIAPSSRCKRSPAEIKVFEELFLMLNVNQSVFNQLKKQDAQKHINLQKVLILPEQITQ